MGSMGPAMLQNCGEGTVQLALNLSRTLLSFLVIRKSGARVRADTALCPEKARGRNVTTAVACCPRACSSQRLRISAAAARRTAATSGRRRRGVDRAGRLGTGRARRAARRAVGGRRGVGRRVGGRKLPDRPAVGAVRRTVLALRKKQKERPPSVSEYRRNGKIIIITINN